MIHFNKLVKYVCCTLLVSLAFSSCEDDEVFDDRMPTIRVEGVANDATWETTASGNAFSLKMIVADNVGLKDYTVAVDSASVNVFSMSSSQFDYKLQHEEVVLNNLAKNFLYQVKITVNDVNANTANFQFQLRINDFQQYAYLGLVGDATVAGWNPGASAAMVQDPDDKAIFTYTGPLKATGEGAIKIASYLGGWCDGDWLFAPQANESIDGASGFVINNCNGPDNKWQVTAANEGNYLVTVNLRNKTINFEKQ